MSYSETEKSIFRMISEDRLDDAIRATAEALAIADSRWQTTRREVPVDYSYGRKNETCKVE